MWTITFVNIFDISYTWHNDDEPADCKLIHETVQQLHAELRQARDVIRWHQFNGS